MKRHIRTLIATLLGIVPASQAQPPNSIGPLMRDVLAAAEAKDVGRLNSLTITEAEFKQYVWPRFVLRHETGHESDSAKFYAEYRKQSEAGAAELIQKFGGQKLQFKKAAILRAVPSQPAKQNFELLDDPNVFVTNEKGAEQMIRLAGGILRVGDTWKVTTYHLRPEQRIQGHTSR